MTQQYTKDQLIDLIIELVIEKWSKNIKDETNAYFIFKYGWKGYTHMKKKDLIAEYKQLTGIDVEIV